MSNIKHYDHADSYLIHYTGSAGRQFKVALDSLLLQQYRCSGVTYGLLHALNLRLKVNMVDRVDLRTYFWGALD